MRAIAAYKVIEIPDSVAVVGLPYEYRAIAIASVLQIRGVSEYCH